MEVPQSACSVCGQAFAVQFRYQVREDKGHFVYLCSQQCHQRSLTEPGGCVCSVCTKRFELEFAFQVEVADDSRVYFCSQACRTRKAQQSIGATSVAHSKKPKRIAVFNHKGGTGKTTTAVNLAAGLAEAGERVLLIDADGQGNVGASLGIRGEQTLYHVLVLGASAEKAAVPVRSNLDVLTSNELLAAAELYLAGRPNRDRVMRERLGERADGYDRIIIDCAPALSLMNQNALVYADSVLVPVSCDYLALVGVGQVLRTLKHVREMLKHPVDILGVLPTFYDSRHRICTDAVATLTEHFGDRVLSPVRINSKLREAPQARKTIFEYAPSSFGALDYMRVVSHVRAKISERRAHESGVLPKETAREGAPRRREDSPRSAAF